MIYIALCLRKKYNLPDRDDKIQYFAGVLVDQTEEERVETLVLERMKLVDRDIIEKFLDLKEEVVGNMRDDNWRVLWGG